MLLATLAAALESIAHGDAADMVERVAGTAQAAFGAEPKELKTTARALSLLVAADRVAGNGPVR